MATFDAGGRAGAPLHWTACLCAHHAFPVSVLPGRRSQAMLNAPLARAIAAAAGLGDTRDLCLVQCSSAGATGAIILHAWVRREKFARLVVKTPRDPRLHHALRREWEAVAAIRQK